MYYVEVVLASVVAVCAFIITRTRMIYSIGAIKALNNLIGGLLVAFALIMWGHQVMITLIVPALLIR